MPGISQSPGEGGRTLWLLTVRGQGREDGHCAALMLRDGMLHLGSLTPHKDTARCGIFISMERYHAWPASSRQEWKAGLPVAIFKIRI